MSTTTSRETLLALTSLLFVLSVKSQQYVGDACTFTNGSPGVCSLVDKCPSVYAQLMAGNPPDKLCGFQNFDPIICCPTDVTPRPVTAQPVTNAPQDKGDNRGELARQKCAEYAKAVYSLVYPPTLVGNRQPVNVSLCAVKTKTLIVGGTKADPKEFPHMAAIGYNMETAGIGWYCGGSLVSERFVLTAAHCTYARTWGAATWVRVGDLNLQSNDDDAKPQDRRIVERIRHPEYKGNSRYHDIALLQLESPVQFNAWVRPACLHTSPDLSSSSKAIATGWGKVDWSDESGSADLLKVTLTLVPQPQCNSSFTEGTVDSSLRSGIIGRLQICAGEVGKDTCQGDSGGPLTIFSTDQNCMYDIIGVTSFGRLCGSIVPGVYTRVYNYVPWLESVLWPRG